MKNRLMKFVVFAFAFTMICGGAPGQDTAKTESAMTINPKVKLQTSMGDIIIKLNGEKAPISTENFLQYVKDGFYDGTIFHRVISTFMIQGGGFTADLNKKSEGLRPGIKNEGLNGLKNEAGTIAMARTSSPDSATAQFFINLKDNDSLNGRNTSSPGYAVFGKVVEGMNVVEDIKNTPVRRDSRIMGGREKCLPMETVVIKKATIMDNVDYELLKKKAEESTEKAKEARIQKLEKKKNAVNDLIKQIEVETGQTFQQTDSGLKYLIVREGTGEKPTMNDEVVVNYKGTLVDGTEFDNSYERKVPTSFELVKVVKGFSEGLTLTKKGGKTILIIPGALGYGKRGIPPTIGPDETLVFEVELIDIK